MNKEFLDFPFEIKSEDVEESGIFRGYASTFGVRGSKPDAKRDVVLAGAFGKSIQQGGHTGNGIALLWQHETHNPIGVWNSLVEDKRGLKVEGQLALGVQQGKEAHELLKIGAINGLSYGFDVLDYEKDEKSDVRYLKEVDLWEISPVTFPANVRARVTQVKAMEDAKTERELERALRDATLSKKEALYIVSLCRNSLRDAGKGVETKRPGKAGQLSQVLSRLREMNVGIEITRRITEDF